MKIHIDNSKANALDKREGSSGWKNHRRNLYNTIATAENRDELGNEAYLVYPADAYRMWPRASGEHRCKYIHHIIEDGEIMFLSVNGVKAAYARAKQQGIFKGKVKEHLERHYRELGLYEGSTMPINERIEENFGDIEGFIERANGDMPGDLNSTLKELGNPSELLTWMKKNISYGYMDSAGQSHGDDIDDEDFFKAYRLQKPEEMMTSRVGVCWDQTEFERVWFDKHWGGTFDIFYLISDEQPGYDTHTCVVYKETYRGSPPKYFWFENSWEPHRGIHAFNSVNEALEDIRSKFLKFHGLSKADKLNVHRLVKPPKFGISCQEFLEYASGQPPFKPKGDTPPEVELTTEGEITVDPNDELDWLERYLTEGSEDDPPPDVQEESRPKQTDKAEEPKNGVNRKALYISFIEWAKGIRPKNTFGSVFDKDAFTVTYPFVPNDMRYFYRLANPLLCVLEDNLTFFALSELGKVNQTNPHRDKLFIFAGTEASVVVFNVVDKAVYTSTETDIKAGKVGSKLGDNFDNYLENLTGTTLLS